MVFEFCFKIYRTQVILGTTKWLSDKKSFLTEISQTIKISLNLFWSSISMSRLCSFDLSLSTLSQPSSVMPPVIRYYLKQGWGSGFGQKPDPGLCTSNEGRFLKVYWMNMLDNFERLLFCFYTLLITHYSLLITHNS